MARINGTSGNDSLTNSNSISDQIYGLAGNDTFNISGSASDKLYGGAGNDTFNITGGTHTVADFSKMGTNGSDTLNVGNGATAIVTGVLDFTGYAVTNNGTILITGSSGRDTINGTAGVDSITGGNGNDSLTGNGGADIFNVTAGIDTITDLGFGSDVLKVSAGATANATLDDDNFTATSATSNSGTANLTSAGFDVDLSAAVGTKGFKVSNDDDSSGADFVGSAKDDTLIGANSNDTLTGGAGNDSLTGDSGNDTFNVDSGTDTVTDLSNSDTLVVSAGATAIVTDVLDFTGYTVTNDGTIVITGTAGRDLMIGTTGVDSMIGGADNDSLTGSAGDDILDGGTGADRLIGGDNDDTYIVDNVGDAVVELDSAGIDSVKASISYTLTAFVEHLTLTGNAALNGTGNELNNELTGNSSTNSLYGGAGIDTLDGGAGADKLYGGSGDDTYYVDNTGDKVIENASEGNDTVYASVNHTLANNVEDLYLTGTGFDPEEDDGTTGTTNLSGTGNAAANDIYGNAGNNTLNGKDGDDGLYGGNGNDMLNGDAGDDELEGGAGNDSLKGGSGSDNLTGGAGNDIFNVDAGTDTITDLGSGTDVLVVASGATADANLVGDFTATSATKNSGSATLTQGSDVTVISLAAAGGTAGYTVVLGSADAAHATGSKFADIFEVTGDATHTIEGGAGNDRFEFDSQSSLAASQVFGGAGSDTLQLTTDTVTLADIDFKQVFSVETLQLANGTNSVTLDSYAKASSLISVVGGSGVDTIDASATAYTLSANLNGGAGDDSITGSAQSDTITGGAGADDLTGGNGADTFVIASLADAGDTINDFNVAESDVLDLSGLTFDGTGSLEITAAGGAGTDIDVDVAVIYYTADDTVTTAGDVDAMLDNQNGSDGSGGYHSNKTIVLTDDGTDTYVWLDGHRDLTGGGSGATLIATLVGVEDCSTVVAQLDLIL